MLINAHWDIPLNTPATLGRVKKKKKWIGILFQAVKSLLVSDHITQ